MAACILRNRDLLPNLPAVSVYYCFAHAALCEVSAGALLKKARRKKKTASEFLHDVQAIKSGILAGETGNLSYHDTANS